MTGRELLDWLQVLPPEVLDRPIRTWEYHGQDVEGEARVVHVGALEMEPGEPAAEPEVLDAPTFAHLDAQGVDAFDPEIRYRDLHKAVFIGPRISKETP